jgi:uncharacterized damage-inducible protein DinB
VARLSRTATIDLFRTDMRRLLAAVRSLSEERRRQPIYTDWTVKAVLAHIAARDRELLRAVDAVLADRRAPFANYREADFNAAAVADSEDLAFDEVLAQAQEAHAGLMRRLEALSDDDWEHTSGHQWSNAAPMTAGSIFDYRYKGLSHYGGHAVEIELWAKG